MSETPVDPTGTPDTPVEAPPANPVSAPAIPEAPSEPLPEVPPAPDVPPAIDVPVEAPLVTVSTPTVSPDIPMTPVGTTLVDESDVCPNCGTPYGPNVDVHIDSTGKPVRVHTTCYRFVVPEIVEETVTEVTEEAAPSA